MDEAKIIRRVSAVGIGGNIILVAFKLYAGIAGNSSAMVSDAVHSLSDVFATFVAWIGVRLARKDADEGHPYGHERFECLASLALGLILLGTGIGIGSGGVKSLVSGDASALEIPGNIALIAAAVSIVSKEAMFRYTRSCAKKLNSSAFMADAWHHRSDALSSVGSFIGIAGAILGYPAMDAIACVVICICILKVAADILREALAKLMDSSCGETMERELSDFISAQAGVEGVDMLRSRRFGDKVYLDAEIAVDGSLSLSAAHDIAEAVHDAVEQSYPNIKHIMIHENPASF